MATCKMGLYIYKIQTYMICTIAPQPETASLSTPFISAWLIVSNRSSGSYRNNQQHMRVQNVSNSLIHGSAYVTLDVETRKYHAHCVPIVLYTFIGLTLGLTYHIWSEKGLAHAVHLFSTRTTHHKIVFYHRTAN